MVGRLGEAQLGLQSGVRAVRGQEAALMYSFLRRQVSLPHASTHCGPGMRGWPPSWEGCQADKG